MNEALDNKQIPAVLRKHATSYWRGIRSGVVDAAGFETAYLEAGEKTADVVILLHGFAGSRTHWRSFMLGLKDSYRTIAVEIPGFNLVEMLPGRTQSLRLFSDWLEAFMDSLEVQQAHIIGFSSGACLAAYFATLFPEKTSSLCFISFPNIYVEAGSKYQNLFDECLYSDICRAEDMETLWKAFFYDPPALPRLFYSAWYRAYSRKKPAMLKLVRDVSQSVTLLFSRMSLIGCSVLAVRGSHDENSDAKMNDHLSRAITYFSFVEIPRASHLCYIERYKETLSAVVGFLKENRQDTDIRSTAHTARP